MTHWSGVYRQWSKGVRKQKWRTYHIVSRAIRESQQSKGIVATKQRNNSNKGSCLGVTCFLKIRQRHHSQSCWDAVQKYPGLAVHIPHSIRYWAVGMFFHPLLCLWPPYDGLRNFRRFQEQKTICWRWWLTPTRPYNLNSLPRYPVKSTRLFWDFHGRFIAAGFHRAIKIGEMLTTARKQQKNFLSWAKATEISKRKPCLPILKSKNPDPIHLASGTSAVRQPSESRQPQEKKQSLWFASLKA